MKEKASHKLSSQTHHYKQSGVCSFKNIPKYIFNYFKYINLIFKYLILIKEYM